MWRFSICQYLFSHNEWNQEYFCFVIGRHSIKLCQEMVLEGHSNRKGTPLWFCVCFLLLLFAPASWPVNDMGVGEIWCSSMCPKLSVPCQLLQHGPYLVTSFPDGSEADTIYASGLLWPGQSSGPLWQVAFKQTFWIPDYRRETLIPSLFFLGYSPSALKYLQNNFYSYSSIIKVILVDLEQHKFEMCGSTYMWMFFQSVLQYYIIQGWLNPRIQNHRHWGPTMGLEQPWILVSIVGPGSNSLLIPRDKCTSVSHV